MAEPRPGIHDDTAHCAKSLSRVVLVATEAATAAATATAAAAAGAPQDSQVSKADFPLPTLGPLLADIQQEVLRGRGFALIRGLPVERWSRLETLVAYWGIGLHWWVWLVRRRSW